MFAIAEGLSIIFSFSFRVGIKSALPLLILHVFIDLIPDHIFLYYYHYTGLEIATNTVAFVTKFFPLPLKYLEKSQISLALSKQKG